MTHQYSTASVLPLVIMEKPRQNNLRLSHHTTHVQTAVQSNLWRSLIQVCLSCHHLTLALSEQHSLTMQNDLNPPVFKVISTWSWHKSEQPASKDVIATSNWFHSSLKLQLNWLLNCMKLLLPFLIYMFLSSLQKSSMVHLNPGSPLMSLGSQMQTVSWSFAGTDPSLLAQIQATVQQILLQNWVHNGHKTSYPSQILLLERPRHRKFHQPQIVIEMPKPNPASKLNRKFAISFSTSLVNSKSNQFSKSQSNG